MKEDIFERHIRFFKQEIRRHGDINPSLVLIKGNMISLIEPTSRSAFDAIISFFKPDKYMFFSISWPQEELLNDYKSDIAKSKHEQLICLYISTDKKVMKSIPIKRRGKKVVLENLGRMREKM